MVRELVDEPVDEDILEPMGDSPGCQRCQHPFNRGYRRLSPCGSILWTSLTRLFANVGSSLEATHSLFCIEQSVGDFSNDAITSLGRQRFFGVLDFVAGFVFTIIEPTNKFQL